MRYLKLGLWLMIAILSQGVYAAEDARDPWSGFNRKVFKVNDVLDHYLVKPVARGYRAVTPRVVNDGITNFFSNLDDVLVVLNDGLQGKFDQGSKDLLRIGVNTTFGLAGLIDVGTRVGLPKHAQDFGLTLGVWGVPSGPYLVLPVLGPSTVRDAPGRGMTIGAFPTRYIGTKNDQLGLDALYFIDTRADLIPLEAAVDVSADRYSFVREVYLQRRDFLLNQGKPAKDPFMDESGEDSPAPSGEGAGH